MSDRLPYKLSEGVAATREGIRITPNAPVAMAAVLASDGFEYHRHAGMTMVWEWPDAAERLRYRECEPWIEGLNASSTLYAGIIPPHKEDNRRFMLHRLAAILCDDAEAFRVLHWCVNNLPEEKENE